MSIATRYLRLRTEIDESCRACGRAPEEVLLLAVSKTVGVPEVREAIAAGAHAFGENRPDLLAAKQAELPQEAWHFIGNVQSRKIPEIVAHAALIHSLYEPQHIARVNVAAEALGKVQRILLEVNVSGEESKSGLAPDAVEEMLHYCESFSHVKICGLMTMAPQGDLVAASACFEGLAALRDKLMIDVCPGISNADLHELSMGMSEDWQCALPLGATMVRIGRAVFDDAFE
ncbi:MAG: YggS family pyridoxal phosphate-dependent enzyme [Raoultibacter sp.]